MLPTIDATHPRFIDVLVAAARIAPHARVTPVLRVGALDAIADARLFFKAEHLQHGGAFKFRGASNAVWSLPDRQASRGVVTHSSGNHGAALALAARARAIPCHVVVPETIVSSKLAAIAAAGATVHPCAPTIAARENACAQVQAATGATLVHPYTNPAVMAGQGTAVLELLDRTGPLDVVIAPVGGGGLASGTAIALAALAPETRLLLAEPAGAADTFASLRAGRRITDIQPDTVCDGLRATLGEPNFAILHAARIEVTTVDDDAVLSAQALFRQHARQVIEPSSATVLAAVLQDTARFAGLRVGLILTGGNVEADARPA